MTAALKRPFLKNIREGIPYDGNELRLCMITDRPEVLRHHYQTCQNHKNRKDGVYPTHPGADFYLTDPATRKALDEYAREYEKIADDAWVKGDWERILPDSPEVEKLRKKEAAKLPQRKLKQKYPWERVALPMNQAISGKIETLKKARFVGHVYEEEPAEEENKEQAEEIIPASAKLCETK
jgi:hypothetical protein